MGLVENKKKLKKRIKKAKNVFLMGHKNLDLDAIGSCIGMYNILKQQKKECFIVIDDIDTEMGVTKVLKEIDGCYNIIKSEDIPVYLHKKNKKNLLMILDTNKKCLVQNESSLDYFTKKIIIDHHDLGKDTIEDALIITEENTSSTCEIVVNIINLYNIDISPYVCTLLLSGIILDTNNFTLKTTADTYYAAYFLTAMGGSPKKVQYLLKQDITEYVERQKLLSSIEVIDNIAITKGTQYITYRREDLAKIADTLLFFNDIEASFVIGKIGKDLIGLSARSLGNYNITNILEHLGGGGDAYNGACTFEKKTISEAHTLLKKELKKQNKQ
ncbi:MAG: hypothetical protein HFJ38_04285 [Bacilli bacterium]|nr:hypothetical protein [Bacilli bacterium]